MAVGGQCLWGTVVVIHLLHWHSFYKILSTALLTSAWRWDSLPIGACGSFGEAARPNALALAGRRLGFVAGLHVRSPTCSQAQILASGLCLPYVAFAVSVGLCICCSCSRHYLAACTCFAGFFLFLFCLPVCSWARRMGLQAGVLHMVVLPISASFSVLVASSRLCVGRSWSMAPGSDICWYFPFHFKKVLFNSTPLMNKGYHVLLCFRSVRVTK